MAGASGEPNGNRVSFPRVWPAPVAAAGISLGTIGLGSLVLGRTASPFGWAEIAVAHVLATLPLAWLLAQRLAAGIAGGGVFPQEFAASTGEAGQSSGRPGRRSLWLAALAGVLVSAGSIALASPLAENLDISSASSNLRLAVRIGYTLAMLSPWMLIGALSHRRRWPDEQYVAPIEPSAALLIVAVLASIVLPATFGRKFAETRTNEANTLIAERRTVEARRIVRRLADFGSSMSITIPTRRDGELPKPAEALAVLDRAVAQLNAEVARLHRLPDSASNRLAVASRLMSLDRWAEAEKMLRRLAGAHGEVQATLLLAEGYQHEHAWQQSNEQFQRIVSSSPPEEKAGWSSFEKVLVRSYKGLAYNYREQRRYDDAEAVYVEALQRLPEVPRQAEFHFLLGRHFEQGGKAHEALVHLRRAVALDPQRFQSRAAPILQEIGRQTPACFPVPMSDEQ